MAQAQQMPWDNDPIVGTAAPATGGPVYGAPAKASDLADDARKDAADKRAAATADREAVKFKAEYNADGTLKPVDPNTGKPTESQSKDAGFYGRMMQSEQDWASVPETDRGPRGLVRQSVHASLPGVENTFVNSDGRQKADQAMENFIAASLRHESGAAVSQGEFDRQFKIFYPQPGDGPELIAQKERARQQAINGMKISAGPLAEQAGASVVPIPGSDKAAVASGGPADTTPPPPPIGGDLTSPGETTTAVAATGDNRTVADPAMSSAMDAMIRKGAPLVDINTALTSKGFTPIKGSEYAAWRDWYSKHPDYQGSSVDASKLEPISGFDKAVTTVGDNPVGAYFVNAGQFLSGNTLDNMASDPERARASMDVISNQNPKAALAGQVSGGVLSSALGEAGLARAGMAGGMARTGLADIAMGAANGAGGADNGNRLAGAGMGALAAGAGSVIGQGAAKGLSKAFAPTGGSLSDLYAAGVRPTIGQRLVNANDGRGVTGVIGKAVNATEEALGSVPIVGSAIRGARQDARDQFQVGAFNQALADVGEELPKGMRPGTKPHEYAQEVFKRVYNTARSGMSMVPDEQLATDLEQLAPDIASLGDQARSKLTAIMKNKVNSKLVDGAMNGAGYQHAMTNLDNHIATLGKSTMAEDQELAQVLRNVQSAVDAAARRSSNPDAVALLDAADAGYAKFVRIEEASARKGGGAGVFSPSGFDSAVQKTSGGVRSKAYLRGDALMQDYATAGRSLEDRLPNSGTADRAMIGNTATGGLAFGTATGAVNPLILGVLGAIGGAYAPGVRKVVAGAMAPSGPKARAIAAQLAKRAQLAGKIGAATGAALSQGTAPGP